MSKLTLRRVFDMIEKEMFIICDPVYDKNVEELAIMRTKTNSNTPSLAESIQMCLWDTYPDLQQFIINLNLKGLEGSDKEFLEEVYKCKDDDDDDYWVVLPKYRVHHFFLLVAHYFEEEILEYSFANFFRKVGNKKREENAIGKNFRIQEINLHLIHDCLDFMWITSGMPKQYVPKLIKTNKYIAFQVFTRRKGTVSFIFPESYFKVIVCKNAVITWLCIYNRTRKSGGLSKLNKDVFMVIARMLDKSRDEDCWLPKPKNREKKRIRL